MARSTPLQKTKSGKLASKKSKSGDPRCSAAASAWARGQATSDTYKLLGECRSKARMQGQANLQREAGNEGKAQVLEKRAERGLTAKARVAKAKELLAARKAKIDAQVTAGAQAKAGPSLREQADAARMAKGNRAERVDSLRMRAYEVKQKHSNAALNAGRNQSQYLQKAAKARTPQSKADWQNMAGAQSQVANREFGKVGRVQRWTDKLDSAASPARPDRRAQSAARLEQRKAAMASPAGQAKLAEQKARAESRQRGKFGLFGNQTPDERPYSAPIARAPKGDRTTRLKALADKAMSLAERRATKANSLTGAAQDRMLDRSMMAAQRYNRLETARTPFTPASKATPSLREQAAAARAAKGSRTERLAVISEKAAARWNATDDKFGMERDAIAAKLGTMDKQFRKTKDAEQKSKLQSQADSLVERLRVISRSNKLTESRYKAVDRAYSYERSVEAARPRLKRLTKEIGLLREAAKTNHVAVSTQTKVAWISDPQGIGLSSTGTPMVTTNRDKTPVALTPDVWKRVMRPVRAAKARELLAKRAARA